jgi:hypothetical protein
VATIRIKHSDYDRIGTSTLIGWYSNSIREGGENPNELVIEIEQTTIGYRRQNGGPEALIMAEFVPFCLMTDVLYLVSRGVEVSLKQIDVCEPEKGS